GGAEGTGQEERGEHRDAANHGPPPLIRLYGRTWPFGFGGQRGRPDLRKMDIPPYRHYERRDATGLLFLVKPASAGPSRGSRLMGRVIVSYHRPRWSPSSLRNVA